MGDITRVITLGIGPASDIAGLVLIGLNPDIPIAQTIPGCVKLTSSEPYTASLADELFGTATVVVASSATVTVSDATCAIGLPVQVENLTEYWKFEDDSDMEFG